MENRISKNDYYMNIAHAVKIRSNCCSRQVGAIIVLNDRIVSTGYNGTPRNTPNCNEGGCPRCNSDKKVSGIGLDVCLCVHAEENALLQSGCFLHGAKLYSTLSPCLACTKSIINAGVTEFYYDVDYPAGSKVEFELFKSAGVKIYKKTPSGKCDHADCSWEDQHVWTLYLGK